MFVMSEFKYVCYVLRNLCVVLIVFWDGSMIGRFLWLTDVFTMVSWRGWRLCMRFFIFGKCNGLFFYCIFMLFLYMLIWVRWFVLLCKLFVLCWTSYINGIGASRKLIMCCGKIGRKSDCYLNGWSIGMSVREIVFNLFKLLLNIMICFLSKIAVRREMIFFKFKL